LSLTTSAPRDSDDALDKRAQAILDAVWECWRLLSDLEIDDRMIALDKLDDLMTLEALSHIPEAAPNRAH
jgi:hypothetical protein